MIRGLWYTAGVLILAGLGVTAGCSVGGPRGLAATRKTNLLFGSERATVLATQLGRSDWPATYGVVEGPEDTIYLDYYRDYQGHSSNERDNPRRLFRSYRIGTQHR